MALSDFFARFYSKVFIGIYAHEGMLRVGVVTLGKENDIAMQQRTFTGGLEGEAFDFLESQAAQSPYNYIAVLTDNAGCGALPTCSLSKAKEMVPEVGRSKTICVDEEWMNYCDEAVLYALQERYAPLQPDAIYSPFALLHAFFEEPMTGNHAVYLLVTAEAMSMAVVKERHLRFAEQFVHAVGPMVPTMVERIVETLDTYYGKPCCRGEFIESVHIVDGAGVGELLAKALEETLLVEAQYREVDAALLCAQTCMKENGYGI